MERASVVALCRAGFEAEAARDLDEASRRGRSAFDSVDAAPGTGFVAGTLDLHAAVRVERALLEHATFVRSAALGVGPVELPHEGASRGGRADRVTPLLAAIEALGAQRVHAPPWRSAWVEYPDTNEGKALSPLSRALAARIDAPLRSRGEIDEGAARRLHVVLADGRRAWIGTSDAVSGTAWPLGIPRLRMPGAAPSRSTLKLAEAFVVFLGERETTLLRPGLRAVDLGAAPGGWTWQFAQRGLRVTAVDNGALKGEVATDPLVTHVRADGLAWRPRKPVDWLVCDIVLTPSRIADLVANWIAERLARRAIFNLKLPMKKRWDEVERCRSRIVERLDAAGLPFELRLRQLYHDREEVTGYLARVD